MTPKRFVLLVVGVGILAVLYVAISHILGGTFNTARNMALSSAAPVTPELGALPSDSYQGTNSYSAPTSTDMPIVPPIGNTPPAGNAQIVKSGNLSLTVNNVDDAVTQIQKIRDEVGGQEGGANFYNSPSGTKSGTITIWVPSDQFDASMAAIKKVATKVNSESTNVEDVSAQVVDIDARLKNLQATEAQYLDLMKQSGSISDILSVEKELSATRQQIEELQGQQDYLARQVALSSIRVNLSEEISPATVTNTWRPLTVAKTAFSQMITGLTDFADMLIAFVIALPVLILNIGFWVFVAWIVYRIGRFVYRRMTRDHASPV